MATNKGEGKVSLTLPNGETVTAIAPTIVSVSRATDIPAFYAEWFFRRLEEGYSVWENPFNGVRSYISFQNTRFIVFWSKNPRPLLAHIDKLRERGIGCYIQFTLNDYEREGLEKGVPPLSERIKTFKTLVERMGHGRVVWRFDPMILTDNISIDSLIEKVRGVGDQLAGYTDKLVFSFADIAGYAKVRRNLERGGVRYADWTTSQMTEFAYRLSAMNKERGWNYSIATCGENVDLSPFGIEHNKCIDDELIIRIAHEDNELMRHLGAKIHRRSDSLFDMMPPNAIMINEDLYAIRRKGGKDRGQRTFCGCVSSKDIGQYDTCPHMCEYCYANTSKEAAMANYQRHKSDPDKESII